MSPALADEFLTTAPPGKLPLMCFKVYVNGKSVKFLQIAFSLHVKFLKCIPVDGCKPSEVQKRPSVSFDCGRTFHGGNKARLIGPSPLKTSQILSSFPPLQTAIPPMASFLSAGAGEWKFSTAGSILGSWGVYLQLSMNSYMRCFNRAWLACSKC